MTRRTRSQLLLLASPSNRPPAPPPPPPHISTGAVGGMKVEENWTGTYCQREALVRGSGGTPPNCGRLMVSTGARVGCSLCPAEQLAGLKGGIQIRWGGGGG